MYKPCQSEQQFPSVFTALLLMQYRIHQVFPVQSDKRFHLQIKVMQENKSKS